MRARNLKPGLFKNEELGAADPINTLIFAGLWTLADRAGRLEDRPLRIHAEINPYRPPSSTSLALDWLCAEQFIVRYRANGQGYIWIPTFLDHQNPHMREPPSRIPPVEKADGNQGNGNEHDASLVQVSDEHQSSTGLAPVQHQSGPASSLIPPSPFPLPDSSLRSSSSGDLSPSPSGGSGGKKTVSKNREEENRTKLKALVADIANQKRLA